MKKTLLITLLCLGVSACFCDCQKHATHAHSKLYLTAGQGLSAGDVNFQDTHKGLRIDVNLKGLPPGEHGFHIHEKPNCGMAQNADGKMEHALAAGGHYDPHKTGKHLGPDGGGHLGDLPRLNVDKDGVAQTTFYLKNAHAADFKNRSLVIHAGGDNYKDTPKPLGGGGARIACGIVE